MGDEIDDFSRAEGDRIDLSRIDASSTMVGDQAFNFVGSARFTGTAGELRYASGELQGDVNGDGSADFRIDMQFASLQVSDLIL